MWETLVLLAVVALTATLLIDIWKPWRLLTEGFLVGPGSNPLLMTYFPRRGDVGFTSEESGFISDPRNVRGYADVQGLGVNHDFCRMVIPKGKDDKQARFFACALGGTENLSSTSYRTLSVKDGFKTSRDDYMTILNSKASYCAVVKMGRRGFLPMCYPALETGFDTKIIVDPKPPADIQEILSFYDGCIWWFRLIDDLKDYAENLDVYTTGNFKMDESLVKGLPSQYLLDGPGKTTGLYDRVELCDGLQFNGVDAFLRLGDSPDMGFGKKIQLSTLAAMTFWVYFDEFTNNAHIVDFGNGAGIDNIFVGIIGRGDETIDKGQDIRPPGCAADSTLVMPDWPSGAQGAPVMSPQQLMLTTDANVEEVKCPGAAVLPRKLDPLKPPTLPKVGKPKTATLLYEVWNGKQRMMQMKIDKAIALKEWTHVAITTASSDNVRPTLRIYINGRLKAENPDGYLPQTSFTTNNYVGKSNWEREGSQFENKPELFKGKLFDFRGYRKQVSKDKLAKTIDWGKARLGLLPTATTPIL
jgi:hypothetical protein